MFYDSFSQFNTVSEVSI